MMARQKPKAMATKRRKNKEGISLFSKKDGNYEGDAKNYTDPDKTNNK